MYAPKMVQMNKNAEQGSEVSNWCRKLVSLVVEGKEIHLEEQSEHMS